MKILLLLLSFFFLSGCVYHSEPTGDLLLDTSSLDSEINKEESRGEYEPSQVEMPNGERREIRIPQSIEKGVMDDENSIYWGWKADKPSGALSCIYREIKIPDNFEYDNFNGLFDSIDSTEMFATGDALLPYLLSKKVAMMSDEELKGKFEEEDIFSYIYSVEIGGTVYRVIGVAPHDDFSMVHAPYQCFIQYWNDEFISAQPLVEGWFFVYEKMQSNAVSILKEQSGKIILTLAGYEHEYKQIYQPVFVGFELDAPNYLWKPIEWGEMYSSCILDQAEQYRDGLRIWAEPKFDEQGRWWNSFQPYIFEMQKKSTIDIMHADIDEKVDSLLPLFEIVS